VTQPADAPRGAALPETRAAGPDHRWLILGVIALAQLMIILDATIMNIALPSAQKSLGFSVVDRQWVVTAYALAFGSLLLLGGKLSDLLGRKVTFLVGLIGFAAASAIGGASVSFGMLVAARACQGAFGRCSPRRRCRCSPSRSPTRRSAARRSRSTARSPGPAARSGCCWAGCSPSTCPGGGACTST
jgi:sugar phosphate permease